jgi:hypothetical protein
MSVSEKICEIVGYRAFEKICDEFGGISWNIPSHPPANIRDSEIQEEFQRIVSSKKYETTAKTYRAVAHKYGVTVRKVQQVISRVIRNNEVNGVKK